jgi:succinate dehydrogenase / fumarate reductase cytochrome b subunit
MHLAIINNRDNFMSENQKKRTKLDIHARRPVSPHLGIYKLQISSGLSALHRITGFVLFGSSILFLWWLIALIYTDFCSCALAIAKYNFTKVIFWALLSCLYYHSFNGIRHLFWDMGVGYSLKAIDYSGYLILALTVLASVSTIFIIF